MKPTEQDQRDRTAHSTAPMPVLFIGHGTPMNAIEDNEFSRGWRQVGKILRKPEHYLPLLYALGPQQEHESILYFNDQPVGGSLTMTLLIIDDAGNNAQYGRQLSAVKREP